MGMGLDLKYLRVDVADDGVFHPNLMRPGTSEPPRDPCGADGRSSPQCSAHG